MNKADQKQIQRLRELKEKLEEAQDHVLSELADDEAVRIALKYCREILMNLKENLSEYSPSHLSKFIFEEQVKAAKVYFDLLPEGQCKIEHFIIIMLKVMNFSFEKWPYCLVGFMEMFSQIAMQGKNYITYHDFFKYVIGEVLDFKEEEQNTQFQVRFQQLKKQDYLLHDTGIKQFYFSSDLKMYFTLDIGANIIKVYNQQMKIIKRFTPNKQKHNKKFPTILWFDYSQMTNRLGLVFSDHTFSIINFYNFLHKTKNEFEALNANEIVVPLEDKMLKVVYIQMINRWALVSDENKLYLFDLEKYRQQDTQYISEVKMENPEFKITQILELVNLSTICVVAGFQIHFFNDNFTQKMYQKYVHSTEIENLRYCEENNTFYVAGEEKVITMFNILRSGTDFHIETFQMQSKAPIIAFEIFPALGTMIVVDAHNEVRLIDQNKKICYQTQNYSHIVKNLDNKLKILKISKIEFALYETYTIVFLQEKIAIEKGLEYGFLQDTYYDRAKQQFYFSVNNQIISFSVAEGELRKSLNSSSANVPKHQCFKKGKSTNLFIIDYQKNIYETYLKEETGMGQNRSYKKKLAINTVIKAFLDEEIKYTFIIGDKSIFSVRIDGLNNFTVNSTLALEFFPPIIDTKYNSIKKQIHLFTRNSTFYTLSAETYKMLRPYQYVFPQDPNQYEDRLILEYDYNELYDIDILLTSQNELYIVSCSDPAKQVYLKIDDYLNLKQKALRFSDVKFYPKIEDNQSNAIIVWDKDGHMGQFDIGKAMKTAGIKRYQGEFSMFKYPAKENHTIIHESKGMENVILRFNTCDKIDRSKFFIFKAHQKEIKILERIQIQGSHILTFAIDGQIRLWKFDRCLFSLKLPDLKKQIWEMDEIQQIKSRRSVEKMSKVLEKIESIIVSTTTPEKIMKKNQSKILQKESKRFSHDEPIPLQIQNKELEDVVNKTQNINWYTFRSRQNSKRKYNPSFAKTERSNVHPWRTRSNFRHLYSNASPENKYKEKMPRELVHLRVALDMKERSEVKKQQKTELLILPELNSYTPERMAITQRKKETENEEEQNQQTMQGCMYVKRARNKKNINELDEIDREFEKKWLILASKKWIPTRKDRMKSKTQSKAKSKTKGEAYSTPTKQTKYDVIKQIKELFEVHNRETMGTKKGRLIKIPKINIKKEDLLS